MLVLLWVHADGRSGPAWAAAATRAAGSHRPIQAELGYAHETLSNGSPDWRELYLRGKKTYRPRTALYGMFRLTERFGLSDQEFTLGGSYPLNSRWTAAVEGTYSPSAMVLPRWSATGELHRNLGGGFGLQFALRHREYATGVVDTGSLTIERYWASYRAAYTLSVSQLAGVSTAVHIVQGNYYYGDQSSVSLSLATGQEAETVGAGVIRIIDVPSADLTVRHWLNPDWAVTVGVGLSQVGTLYTRRRAQIGFRWQF